MEGKPSGEKKSGNGNRTKEGMRMYVTYTDLIQFVMMLCSVVTIIYMMTTKK